MDIKHFNELIEVSQEICDHASDKIANFCAQKYCAVRNDTMEQQLKDYLFIAEQTSAYILGNALALLNADTQEKEIQTFTDNLRKVITFAQQKVSGDIRPS